MSLSYIAKSWAVGAPLRPFPSWSQRLADDAAIDPNSDAVVAALAGMSATNHDTLNVWSWTAEPLIVPASQPLVPVHATGMTSQITSILALGVPIPPGTVPTNDSDATLTIWQPDWSVNGINGRYYELFGVSGPNADGSYNARRGAARKVGVNDTTSWGYSDWTASGIDPKGYATEPNSSYELKSWGVQGSGLPYMPGVLTVGDCEQNYCSHTLLLEVPRAQQGQYRAPATRSDGAYTSLVLEGMQFRFPAGYEPPASLHPIAKLIVQAARDFRIIVTDQAGTLAFRAAPSIGQAGYLGSTADYAVLNDFPWRDLQLLA